MPAKIPVRRNVPGSKESLAAMLNFSPEVSGLDSFRLGWLRWFGMIPKMRFGMGSGGCAGARTPRLARPLVGLVRFGDGAVRQTTAVTDIHARQIPISLTGPWCTVSAL